MAEAESVAASVVASPLTAAAGFKGSTLLVCADNNKERHRIIGAAVVGEGQRRRVYPWGRTLLIIVVFQFLHWFQPSEAYYPSYVVPRYNTTIDNLVAEVFAWDTLLQFGAALVAGVALIFGGYRSALCVCAGGSIAAVALTVSGHTYAILLASQAAWALGFTSIFSVLAAVLLLVPPQHYQLAASANQAGMFAASLVSSLVAFGVSMGTSSSSDNNVSSSSTTTTSSSLSSLALQRQQLPYSSSQTVPIDILGSLFYTTLASQTLAALVIFAGFATGALPPMPPPPPPPSPALRQQQQQQQQPAFFVSTTVALRDGGGGGSGGGLDMANRLIINNNGVDDGNNQLKPILIAAVAPAGGTVSTVLSDVRQMLRIRGLLSWILTSACVRGVHTHVLTLWTSMVHSANWPARYNGLVAAGLYLAAACAVFIPVVRPKLLVRCGRVLVPGTIAVCAALLISLPACMEDVSQDDSAAGEIGGGDGDGGADGGGNGGGSYALFAILLTLYHAGAEFLLAVSDRATGTLVATVNSNMDTPVPGCGGSGAKACVGIANEAGTVPASISHSANGSTTHGHVNEDISFAPATANANIYTTRSGNSSSRSISGLLAICLVVRFVLSLAVQAAVELIVYPTWGRMPNIFGLNLTTPGIARGLGVALAVFGFLVLPFSRKLADALIDAREVGALQSGGEARPTNAARLLRDEEQTPLLSRPSITTLGHA